MVLTSAGLDSVLVPPFLARNARQSRLRWFQAARRGFSITPEAGQDHQEIRNQ